jgi:hypothetical protein
MSVDSLIQSQYQAALEMLKEAVTRCPEELWDDTALRTASGTSLTTPCFTRTCTCSLI